MFKETRERLIKKSPKYFVKIKKYALIIGASGAAIMTANSLYGLVLDDIFLKIISYLVAICAGVAATAQLTKE